MPWNKNNPVTVQVLGICSCLAVTAQLKPAVVMALSVTVVVALSNLIISLMRKTIPPRIRIIVQLVVVSMLVVLVDQLLKAYVYDVSKQLSVFVGLIITTVWGYPVMEKLGIYNIGYENNGLMIMPPMALILVGIIIWIQRTRNKDLCE